MALKEMYDYLPTVTPDYTVAILQVSPTDVLVEAGEYRQIVYETDSASTIVTTLSTYPVFTVTLQWSYASLDDTGTILDFYLDSAKAQGQARSFYWEHPTDGHTYVVKFSGPIQREYQAGYTTMATVSRVTLRVIGRKAD